MNYAIIFDINMRVLKKDYCSDTYNNVDYNIQKVLNEHGFKRSRGNFYIVNENRSSVDCFLAVQELTDIYPWFASCVYNIRMLRIEEDTDLMRIVDNTRRLKRINS